MQIYHHSREAWFRSPYGARPVADYLRLRLAIFSKNQQTPLDVRLHYAYGLERFATSSCQLELRQDPELVCPANPDAQVWETQLYLPTTGCLFFYWFELRLISGRVFYYVRGQAGDGRGVLSARPPQYEALSASPLRPWQVTVYEPVATLPDWYLGRLMYQIFPDRFRRGPDFSETRMREVRPARERIYHSDWNEDVDINGREEGYLAADFFGGTLSGIREKLDYLADLGVEILYLNPIFMARSNHRYDTADYEKVDPMLGDEYEFQSLCREAKERGIGILLDGVFSHTGADSRYFNRYGRFPEVGAWQSAATGAYSPWSSWYQFRLEQGQMRYDCWWNFPELPAVREQDLAFRHYILGPDGIVRRWLRLGASGFRIDVSDELPDDFLRELYSVTKDEKPDAIILGEVWEDASAKVSYGHYRDFLLGRSHDCVMGYVFRDAVTAFFRGEIAADQLMTCLESLREHYPPTAYVGSMNLLSSHDISRFITAVAGAPDPGERRLQQQLRLTEAERRRGEGLIRLATAFQYLTPGTPSLYYGDEIGMEGYRDPFNRRTFDWEKVGEPLAQDLARLGRWRRERPFFGTAGITWLVASGRVLCIKRFLEGGRDLLGREIPDPGNYYLLLNLQDTTAHLTVDERSFRVPADTLQLVGETESLVMSFSSLEISDGSVRLG
ncbi:MAG: glycoside hydrolase family 13 protein [Bacillota bacterium]|nr:glycoside hydrolase family 13 protein [Bacillota bacterium]